MAEFVVGLVKDKLASFLKDEASLLKDVHQEVEEIKQELVSIQLFLKDADKRAEAEEDVSDGVRAWVQELRGVAFVVEDVVTEYKHYVAQQQHSGPRGITKFVRETGVSILFEELGNLTQLRTLGITKLRSEDGSTLCGCLEQMMLLETLFVSSMSENETIDLEFMSSPPRLLRHLVLSGPLRKLPEWITQLENLTKIRLLSSRLEDDTLQVLKNMHNLLELFLFSDAYVGEHLQLDAGAFPNLKKLYISSMSRLRSFAIEETALPMLERLRIGCCPEMNEFPSGLQHLRNLKSIIFLNMPREFKTSDLHTLQHVPDIQTNSLGNEGLTMTFHRVEYPHSKVAVTYERDLQGRLISVKRARTTSLAGADEDQQAIEGDTTSRKKPTSASSKNQQ